MSQWGFNGFGLTGATPLNSGLSVRVMEYTVVTAKDKAGYGDGRPENSNFSLAGRVNKLIKEGWRPLGPAQMVEYLDHNDTKIMYSQTMVKDEND